MFIKKSMQFNRSDTASNTAALMLSVKGAKNPEYLSKFFRNCTQLALNVVLPDINFFAENNGILILQISCLSIPDCIVFDYTTRISGGMITQLLTLHN